MACFYHSRRRWSLIASVRGHPNMVFCWMLTIEGLMLGRPWAGAGFVELAGSDTMTGATNRGNVVAALFTATRTVVLSRDGRREGKAPMTLTLGRDLGYGWSPS